MAEGNRRRATAALRLAGPILVLLVALGSVLLPPCAGALPDPAGRAQPGEDLAPPKAPAPPHDRYVGATFTTNSAGWAQVMSRSDAAGVLVVLVIADSPAAAAGLSPGDIIVAMDDQPIRNDRQPGLVLRTSSSETFQLTVIGPNGTVRPVRIDAQPRPSTGLSDALQRQVAADPSPANRLVYAQVAPEAGTALAILDELIAEFPGLAEAHAARSQRLLDVGVARDDRSGERLSAIKDAISRAIALDPRSLTVQLTAARVYATMSEGEEAARHAEQAVMIDDSSAAAHSLLGTIRLDLGQPGRALPALHRAVELDPYVDDYYRALSASYRAVGQPQLASQTDAALEALGAVRRSRPSRDSGRPLAVLGSLVGVTGAALVLAGRGDRGGRSPRAPRGKAGVLGGLAAVEWSAALAVFSVAVPTVGRSLDLSAGAPMHTEIVDHVAPGVVMLIVSAFAIRRAARSQMSHDHLSVTALLLGLSALWMSVTHVPLLVDAIRGDVAIETAAFHSVAGPLAIVLAIALYRTPPPQLGRQMTGRAASRPTLDTQSS